MFLVTNENMGLCLYIVHLGIAVYQVIINICLVRDRKIYATFGEDVQYHAKFGVRVRSELKLCRIKRSY